MFVDLLTTSGLRKQEAASLLTFEVPTQQLPGGQYCHGTVAAESTRAKWSRTFYTPVRVAAGISDYVDSSRAWAVRSAQRRGLYDRLPMRLVTAVTRGRSPRVRWVGPDGPG